MAFCPFYTSLHSVLLCGFVSMDILVVDIMSYGLAASVTILDTSATPGSKDQIHTSNGR